MTAAPPSLGETVTEAQRLLDHDAPEQAATLLAATASSAPDREVEVWQGLTLLAEGLALVSRRDDAAAVALRRGAELLDAHTTAPPHALDVPGLVDWAEHLVTALGDGTFPASPPIPRLRLP
ncbi:DUF309 domain-containing protein [Rhodococcus gannanensis]|uniref:DUF309 domain-containing protein n=1 Tax=Rhodococcus gannanensis TaxID=1960308 RepID=A0ABW4P1Y8_9NOCA